MEFLLSRFRNLTVLLVVIMAQLTLLAYQVKSNEDVRLIRVWAVTAVTPLARVLEFVRQNTIGVVENYFILINVRDDNKQLQTELGRLKMENQFLKSELRTADRAQALQAFQARTPSRMTPARVIGTGTGATSRVVFIDRGSGDGIIRGMAVVTPDGIVGRVINAYPTASQVLLITDGTFAAGVISEKNRVQGTLKGVGQSKCIVDYVQNEEKIEVGEMLYTSGDDRVFPKGMPVGRVTVVREGKTFKEVFVVPSGFQQGLEEVLVVTEGVHQPIPESEMVASSGVYIMPAPKPAAGVAPSEPSSTPPALSTDADRLRQRYKRIGEAQNHTFGSGGVGARPPNFNLNPDAPPPAPRAVAPEGGGGTAAPKPVLTPRAVTPEGGAGTAPSGRGSVDAGPAAMKPKPPASEPAPTPR